MAQHYESLHHNLYIRKAKAVLHWLVPIKQKGIFIDLGHKAENIFPYSLGTNFPTLQSISFRTQEEGIFTLSCRHGRYQNLQFKF